MSCSISLLFVNMLKHQTFAQAVTAVDRVQLATSGRSLSQRLNAPHASQPRNTPARNAPPLPTKIRQASCGTCGGVGCSKRGNGKLSCCTSYIRTAGKTCSVLDGAPCIVAPDVEAADIAAANIVAAVPSELSRYLSTMFVSLIFKRNKADEPARGLPNLAESGSRHAANRETL